MVQLILTGYLKLFLVLLLFRSQPPFFRTCQIAPPANDSQFPRPHLSPEFNGLESVWRHVVKKVFFSWYFDQLFWGLQTSRRNYYAFFILKILRLFQSRFKFWVLNKWQTGMDYQPEFHSRRNRIPSHSLSYVKPNMTLFWLFSMCNSDLLTT